MPTITHPSKTIHSERLSAFKNVLFLVALFMPMQLWSTELIMIEQDGCHYCMVFDKEILPDYAESVEGKAAPLRRVNLANNWPEDLSNIKRDRLTPTFVLVKDNKEYGRLRGYPGNKNFWKLLKEMLAKLPETN